MFKRKNSICKQL